MAAPTLQAQGTVAANTAGTHSPAIPTHQADDILVAAVISWAPNTAGDHPDIDTPSGWTQIGSQIGTPASSPIDGKIAFFWKRAVDGTTTVTFTRTGTDTGADTCFSARVHVIRGCITSGDPWDAVAAAGPFSAANQAIAAVTVSGSERMVLQILARQDDFDTNPSAPAGWTLGTSLETTTGTDAGFANWRKDNVSASTGADTPTVTAPAQGRYAYLGISFKPPAPGQNVTLPVATETDSSQVLTAKTLATLPVSTESDAAQTLAVDKKATLPVASESDTAQPLTFHRAATLPPAPEADEAQTLTAKTLVDLPIATAADEAQPLTVTRYVTLPVAAESDEAQPLGFTQGGTQSVTLPVATESDGAQALTVVKFVTLPPASETSSPLVLTAYKAGTLTPATTVDTAVDLSQLAGVVGTVTLEDRAFHGVSHTDRSAAGVTLTDRATATVTLSDRAV